MADHNAGSEDAVFVCNRRSGLGDHLCDGLGGKGEIVFCLGIAGRQNRAVVFQVGKPDIHIGGQGFYDFWSFIAAAVADHGNGKFRSGQIKGRGDGRQVVGRGDQVDVVGVLGLKAEKDGGQLPDRNLFAKTLVADDVVLAETAPQGASAEKDGSAAMDSADAGLLPVVKRRPGDLGLCSALAESLLLLAGKLCSVGAALAGAEPAVFVIIGKWGGTG